MTHPKLRLLTAAVVALVATATVLAAEGTVPATDPHAGHTMASPAASPAANLAANPADSPATAAFKAASDAMHGAMAIPYTGNPDIDFIAGMIPHHQGAVDAARIVLEYGTDPEVRKFAQAVIDAQEAEIAWMTDWLARSGQ